MNDPTSQCRSESGWTMYLAQSSYYSYEEEVDGEETNGGGRRPLPDDAEDLSMVSDASSGPPHFREEDCNDFVYGNDCYFQYAPGPAAATAAAVKNGDEKKKKKKKKMMSREREGKQQHDYSCLVDTASSPFINSFSETNYGASNSQASYNWNTNEVQLQGSDSFQRQYCFLDSSVPEKRDYDNPSVFQGNWE